MKLDVARVVPSGGTDTAPERAFLQDRVSLWAFWVFVLAFGFYLVNIVTWPFVEHLSPTMGELLRQPGTMLHLAASLVFGAVFVVARRVPMSTPALRRLETGALVGGCLLFALMALGLAQAHWRVGEDPSMALYAGLLASVNTVAARAIIVPSTPARTLASGAAAMAPLVPVAGAIASGAAAVVNVATWCAVSLAIATVGSRVIFGLRREAARVRRLGQYTLEARIGGGGMGVVYRASHAMLRRPTAIKLLPPDRAGDAALARFEREVQMTAQLSHPNTVAIYDYGRTPDGVFYYAMEYLDGINLEELVARDGPQPPGRVVGILVQVCGSLAEAHERGLVHRDIKPANIILTERGGEPDVAKVVDFGLVKPMASDAPGMTAPASQVLTGTPLYMSPDALLRPDTADPRSDLYAVGAVGYFLLTGMPVFAGSTVAEVIGHHLHTEPVPPSQRAGRPFPPDLDDLVLQCLRKRPEERPSSARVLRDALRRCRHVEPWTADEAAGWWRAFRREQPPAEARTTGEMTLTIDVARRTADEP
jgi:serine/threonine-protein kinase